MKYFFSLLFLSLSVSAFAQPGYAPTRLETKPNTIYKDSAEFNKVFAELYPLIKPTPNPRERAEAMLSHLGMQFRARGIDSAKAYDTAMKAIDPNMDREILYDAYRKEFTAQELKSLVNFFKMPVGTHYLEVEGSLFAARNSMIQEAVARKVFEAIMPMMTKAAENARKAQPIPAPLAPAPPHRKKPQ